MSENINLKELPHQFLLRKYSVNPEVLSTDGKQLLKQLDQTIRLVASKSKDGEVKLTPATQQKISTFDRYICDSIFEYLEEQDKITEAQADKVEEKMDDKREELEEKMDEIHTEEVKEAKEIEAEAEAQAKEEAKEEAEAESEKDNTQPENAETEQEAHADGEEEQTTEKKKSDVLGFWDWE